jgi:vitamin B12 transport system substrate-binding protein
MTSAHALEDARKSNEASLRIISLSPHLTELVYALESQEQLVAVSDYSDYPEQASQLPSVASFQGLDFETIVRLQPSIILAWQGGNKPQDLARLTSLGFKVFYSHPKSLSDISADIRSLGKVLSRVKLSEQLANNFDKRVKVIRQQYEMKSKVPVLYYLWPKPLMTIGPSAWGNELLNLCGARGIFDDAINDYPEVPIESVIKRKPNVIIAVNKESRQQIVNFWEPWLPLLERKKHHIIQANPDLLHRFTPRLLDGLSSLCEQIDISTRNNK